MMNQASSPRLRSVRRSASRRPGRCAVLAAAVALAGCHGVGPDYHGPPKPETAEPARFKNAGPDATRWKPAEPKDFDPNSPWWEIFADPDLNKLEKAAQANNQDLRVAIGRIEESRAQTRVAASDLYPHFDYNGSYTRQRTSSNEPIQRARALNIGSLLGGEGAGSGMTGGSVSSSSESDNGVLYNQPLTRTYSLFRQPVDLTWEVDLFGRVRRNYESERAQRESIEADARNMSLSVAANVALSYFNLRALDTEIDVIQRNIKSRQDGLYIARERLGAGLSSELDVRREEAELAGNEADLAGVQRTRAEMENALATLVGQPASLFRFSRHKLPDAPPPRIPAGLPSKLLERRPDVAAAERQLAAANAQIGVAVAAFFPRITLTGAAGFESATVTDLFTWPSRIWQIGPSVSLPIFEGGRNVANLQATHARYDQQVARYRQQVLVAFQDVENALADLRTLSVQAEAQQRAVEAGQRTLKLATDQFRNGAVTYLDIVDAERTVFNSERTATQLLGQRMQVTVQLIKALGGGWK